MVVESNVTSETNIAFIIKFKIQLSLIDNLMARILKFRLYHYFKTMLKQPKITITQYENTQTIKKQLIIRVIYNE